MSNEPKVTLKQICSKIEITDYAKVLQQVDGLKRYPDVSSCVRECIHSALANVTLDEERKDWVEAEIQRNLILRRKRREKKFSLLGRLFGRS